jgi:hypothetical protein
VEQLKAKGYIVWTPPRPRGAFIGEGDTFTFLNLVGNGLRGYEDSTPGGWAGLGATATLSTGQSPLPPIRINSYDDLIRLQQMRADRRPLSSPDPNFTPAAQNDFAARLRWSVTPNYPGANHEPRVTIRGSARISARPGDTVRLEGVVADPDGNAIAVRWWQWKEVGTYPGQVPIANPTALAASIQVPADATAGQTIQLILEATDDGTPALTRYQRVVVSVVRP